MHVGVHCTPWCGLIGAGNLEGVETTPGYLIRPTGVPESLECQVEKNAG